MKIHNPGSKAIRSIRLRLKYFAEGGEARGEYPLHVVRRIEPGRAIEEATDLLGHTGDVSAIGRVELVTEQLTWVDGATWRGRGAARR